MSIIKVGSGSYSKILDYRQFKLARDTQPSLFCCSVSYEEVKKVQQPRLQVHGLLPPPYYCGRQLRQKKEDFQLPYDLWWLSAHKQLPGRDVVATWNYKRIKNNVFFDIKPVANFEAQACHCRHGNSSPGINVLKPIYFLADTLRQNKLERLSFC